MGLTDLFSSEDRVEIKFSDFYSFMKEATKAELLMNGAKCDTPHAYIREMMTGKREEAAHADCDITQYIKPVFCGIDTGSGESETLAPRETSRQEPPDEWNGTQVEAGEATQEEVGQQEAAQGQDTKESEG